MIVEACAECGCALRDSAGRPITTRNCATCGRTRRGATIEAAARKLLEALPRCDKCSTIATREYFDYDRTRLRCEAHAKEVYGDTPWAEAARELEKALDGGET